VEGAGDDNSEAETMVTEVAENFKYRLHDYVAAMYDDNWFLGQWLMMTVK
jgi:hypothetical protein